MQVSSLQTRGYRLNPLKLAARKPYPPSLRRPFYMPQGCVLHLGPEVRNSWRDLSGNDNHGTITGASKRDGRFGQGLYFDGTNDYVAVADAAQLRFSSELTVCAWIKPTGTPTDSNKIVVKGTNNRRNYDVYMDNTKHIQCMYEDVAGVNYAGLPSDAISTDEWTFVTVVFDFGTNIKTYLDGELNKSKDVAGVVTTNADSVRIGWMTGTWYFRGLIDELMLFPRLLSADEIRQIYLAGTPK